MPGSAGVMEDARRGTESQLAAATDVVASRFGNSRTMNEAGSELQRGANERIDRGKSVINKAYSAIPISDQAQASSTNAVATLQQLTGRFQSNPDLAAAMKDPKLNQYLSALQSGQISWKDLKDFRSIIGEKIGEMRFGESSSTNDLRALYAGLSEDMRNTAASQGPRAVHAFERANTLNRQNEELIQGALTRILGKDGNLAPEKAAAAVQAMTKGGKSTGDLKTLAQVRSATIKSGAWNEIAATLIRLGGQPANSQGRDFNPQTFVNWYADMAEPARRMLFSGENGELRKSLDGFVAVKPAAPEGERAPQHVEHRREPDCGGHGGDNGRVARKSLNRREADGSHGRQLWHGEGVDEPRVRSADHGIFQGGRFRKPSGGSFADRADWGFGGDEPRSSGTVDGARAKASSGGER
jgi:hypothetical protein